MLQTTEKETELTLGYGLAWNSTKCEQKAQKGKENSMHHEIKRPPSTVQHRQTTNDRL